MSLSAQIEESKKGKEASVSLQHRQAYAVHCCAMLLTCPFPSVCAAFPSLAAHRSLSNGTVASTWTLYAELDM